MLCKWWNYSNTLLLLRKGWVQSIILNREHHSISTAGGLIVIVIIWILMYLVLFAKRCWTYPCENEGNNSYSMMKSALHSSFFGSKIGILWSFFGQSIVLSFVVITFAVWMMYPLNLLDCWIDSTQGLYHPISSSITYFVYSVVTLTWSEPAPWKESPLQFFWHLIDRPNSPWWWGGKNKKWDTSLYSCW